MTPISARSVMGADLLLVPCRRACCTPDGCLPRRLGRRSGGRCYRGRPVDVRPTTRPRSYDSNVTDAPTIDELELADWRRRVARLYADVRFLYPDDPIAAWQLWRTEREKLCREHPQSPVPAAER